MLSVRRFEHLSVANRDQASFVAIDGQELQMYHIMHSRRSQRSQKSFDEDGYSAISSAFSYL